MEPLFFVVRLLDVIGQDDERFRVANFQRGQRVFGHCDHFFLPHPHFFLGAFRIVNGEIRPFAGAAVLIFFLMRFGGRQAACDSAGQNPPEHKILAAIKRHFLGSSHAHILAHIEQCFTDDRLVTVRIFRAGFFNTHDSVIKRVL
ncbi:MAG: hypothetical protein SFW64_01775 [Alphaproteobacteria bacterium]|nr:hypothetical protein [Alphaproteobacteria bacterium]